MGLASEGDGWFPFLQREALGEICVGVREAPPPVLLELGSVKCLRTCKRRSSLHFELGLETDSWEWEGDGKA